MITPLEVLPTESLPSVCTRLAGEAETDPVQDWQERQRQILYRTDRGGRDRSCTALTGEAEIDPVQG